MNGQPILEVKNLKTWFHTEDGVVRGCDGVSYSVHRGETLAVVGESGSGKSVSSMSAMRLIPTPPGEIVAGEILFDGKDLVQATEKEMRTIRGNRIAMIFQEPMTSLNPVIPVGSQIAEALLLHEKGMTKPEALTRAVDLLGMVGIPSPEARVKEYPHQMSGGMRQRVMIAMALACKPDVLIADEPTSALDVTIQAQILRLIDELKRELGMAVVMITHDLGVVAETADTVAVMYAGKIVEYGTVEQIFHDPKHPYLEGLRRSMPRIDSDTDELYAIDGMVPNPLDLPEGCKFAPRCGYAMDICREKDPQELWINDTHSVRCWLHDEERENGK